MDIKISGQRISEVECDVFIVPIFEGDAPTKGALAALNTATDGLIASLFASHEIKARRDHSMLLHTPALPNAKRMLFYGAGKSDGLSSLALQRLAAAAIRKLQAYDFATAAFLLTAPLENAASVQALAEGAILGQVKGNLYHTEADDSRELATLEFICESAEGKSFKQAISTAKVMAEATNFARHLTFEPGNELTPTKLAQQAEAMAAREGLACTIMDESEMKQLGMGALLGVSRGSEEPAKLIILRHETDGAEAAPLIALVGKGITFDSGGISIKPANGMEEMKNDMGGGAAVLGAMQIIARLNPRVRV